MRSAPPFSQPHRAHQRNYIYKRVNTYKWAGAASKHAETVHPEDEHAYHAPSIVNALLLRGKRSGTQSSTPVPQGNFQFFFWCTFCGHVALVLHTGGCSASCARKLVERHPAEPLQHLLGGQINHHHTKRVLAGYQAAQHGRLPACQHERQDELNVQLAMHYYDTLTPSMCTVLSSSQHGRSSFESLAARQGRMVHRQGGLSQAWPGACSMQQLALFFNAVGRPLLAC
eukprot:1161311-Pelagomonas_calceolata.AAC.15